MHGGLVDLVSCDGVVSGVTGGGQSRRGLVAQERGLESLLLVIAHARLTGDILLRCGHLVLSRGGWQGTGAVQGHPSLVPFPVALRQRVRRPRRHEVVEHLSELLLRAEDILAELDPVLGNELLLDCDEYDCCAEADQCWRAPFIPAGCGELRLVGLISSASTSFSLKRVG